MQKLWSLRSDLWIDCGVQRNRIMCHRLEGLGRLHDTQHRPRLRQFQWLDLRLLLQQRVNVRHSHHGILVVEPQPFGHHAFRHSFVCSFWGGASGLYLSRPRAFLGVRPCVSVIQCHDQKETVA